MQVYVVTKGMSYEGSDIVGIYLALDEAIAHIEQNPPIGFGDDFILVSAHTVGKDEMGRVIHHFVPDDAVEKWTRLRLWDGTLWEPPK